MSFPAPGDRSLDVSLDLNQLVKNPASTFFMRVEGEEMQGECIHSGDLLIVDRSLNAQPGKLVVAMFEGEFIVRRVCESDGQICLQKPQSEIIEPGDFEVWGVITTIIHSV